ncbi:prefoldin subunit beta [Aeropyrum camini]|uniref:Prefoldin subunit beta n=1 Tax=Aeropyrum camini SY1 = JCM 12091 TaxID=1198449 RepID=U3TA14_9CREN|nr:prefoldin subunit beta [Aeropyrum camini]BAN90372.1 prefoldin beta subunit [Aeropyrum camini SY1 = JCM 12091]
MVERLPPEVEAKYTKYLKLRETLSVVMREKATVEAGLAEVESVLKELEGLPDDAELYRLTGFVLVKRSKNEIVDDLNKRKEDLELKLKVLKSQEEHLKKELERIESELRRLLQGGALGGAKGA